MWFTRCIKNTNQSETRNSIKNDVADILPKVSLKKLQPSDENWKKSIDDRITRFKQILMGSASNLFNIESTWIENLVLFNFVIMLHLVRGLNCLFSCKFKSERPTPFGTSVSQDHNGEERNTLRNWVADFGDSVNILLLQQSSKFCSYRWYHRYITPTVLTVHILCSHIFIDYFKSFSKTPFHLGRDISRGRVIYIFLMSVSSLYYLFDCFFFIYTPYVTELCFILPFLLYNTMSRPRECIANRYYVFLLRVHFYII